MLRALFQTLFRKKRLEQELDDELAAYLEQTTAENVRHGMSPESALQEARGDLGGMERVKENVRAVRVGVSLDILMKDVRYAMRSLGRNPSFTSIAILTIALGIGATTAIYSVVDATLLHPLPYPQPEQLVRIQEDFPGVGAHDVRLSVPEWKDFQNSGIFQYVAPEVSGSVNLTGSSQPARIQVKSVAPNYFTLLGVKPELGRVFHPDDPTPGFNLESVISDGLWKREFGADPHILGRSLRLDNDVYFVIGVMPPDFHDQGRTPEIRNTEIWSAFGFSSPRLPPPARSTRTLRPPIARIKPGLTIAAAQSRLDALVVTLQKQFPADYPPESAWRVHLVPLGETVVGKVRQPLLLMMGAVGLVLLIGCVNVANLLLARATSRGREMAVRQALGGARMRLIRQLLTESLLLSLLGGIAGLAILFFTRKLLLEIIPATLPRLHEISISWTVLLFALGVSVLAGVFFGLAPALQAAGIDPIHVLRQEGRGSKGSRSQTLTLSALVVTEFALSLVLLIAAGLLLRSFWDLYNVRLGFDPDNVMAVRLWLPNPNDPATDIYGTPDQEARFIQEILRRGRSLPGVTEIAAGTQESIPLNHDKNPFALVLEGNSEGSSTRTNLPHQVQGSSVTPEYFHLLGIPLLRGRLFAEFDIENAPRVAIVNEAFARTWWPDQDPLGKRIKLGQPGRAATSWTTVVGVVTDARTETLEDTNTPQVYLSCWQRTDKELAIFLRGRLDLAKLPEQARDMIQSLDPELPVFGAKRLPDVVSGSLSQRRFSMELVLLFALTALLLAGIGVYGTISYIVSGRTRDIGIRIALGAQRRTILHMILRQGLALALAGAALGLVGAWIVSHLMAGLLYGVSPSDPLTFICLTVVLIIVALAACYIPARRAMRVDPIIALREA
ncbi:MAG TPA: ABC transporter permease [Bryobacteraceae bacterium]|jgi:predicted permease|nr:ABC transporter permease [Bryobacteraceae bacterium]